MISIGSKDQFVSQITKQSLFRLILSKDTTAAESGNLTIPYNRLLLPVVEPFYEVLSMEINKSGTLLAVIGEEEIDVVTLPTNIMKGGGVNTYGTSFRIKNLQGKVKKCIWQTVAANDSILVVLNDNSQIKAYDLTKSLDIPVIDVDLKTFGNFKNEKATSISFGSNENLIGGLTLYVSSASNIYAIYPFTSRNINLATTLEAINIALQDTKAAMNLIEQKFPTSLSETASSNLNRASIKQFEYFQYLKNQLDESLPIVKEVRDVHTDKPYELAVVKQIFTVFDGPILQGPLISASSEIQDLISFGDNPLVALFASISSDGIINYYAQLAPMLMKYESTFLFNEESKEPTPEPKSRYIKPKRGFGFIDNSEKEEVALVKRTQSQAVFWKEELTTLDVLQKDKLPVEANNKPDLPSHFGAIDKNRFAIFVNSSKVVIADCSWVKKFVDDLIDDKVDDVAVDSQYGIASFDKEPVTAFAFLKDEITGTGEYLLVFRNKVQDDLEVIQIVKGDENEENKKPLQLTAPPPQLSSSSYIPQKPFAELKSELEILSSAKINHKNIPVDEVPLKEPNFDNLTNLNTFSVRTIQLVSDYSIFGVKLQARILSILDSLKEQQSILASMGDKYKKVNDDQENKLKSLTEKQTKLDQRMSDLQKKIFDALNNSKQGKSLPISDAEKNWYKEINNINAIVNTPIDNEEQSLVEKIENLSLQVESIVSNTNDKTTKLSPVEQLELEKRLGKLRNWLNRENKSINILKDKLTNSLKVIDDKHP
ncbi:Nuclear pore complex subunit, putative (Nucleoporin, putative) [Candida maltosa Xu316]|uniref:Nuclear pore complex subunit, putative (Nucleoporin, putative) n=1 Tax=Candida maltosa (strain Xu316) TaxID=1245528 RepID=M3JDP0_CANMX|nr:Nuclear pore complex subunit, putative (Nucleoporin, putative) [Candida maltosa Xu316]